ncbi:MAG TPA: NrdJb [Xanthomonadales bacterium]|nr:NrdJb [Xanthomonadales bacterium]
MAVKIGNKIKRYSVVKPGAEPAVSVEATTDDGDCHGAEVIQMHERLERPDVLVGSTYKVKSPLFEHALYVTINDIVLNQGTEHESRRPFEIFINSKNMDHFQWIVALTRIMSAVFRKGGDVTFLVEEMKAVFDPRGGYFKAGGVYMPSIVAEIGAVVEDHMKAIGLIVDEDMSPERRRLIAEKRRAHQANQNPDGERAVAETGDYPASATLCSKCSTKAMVLMDGCATCLNCGYSKCG